MWPSSPQHQHLILPLKAFPGRSFFPAIVAWPCSCLRHSPTTCSRSTLFSLGFSSSLAMGKTFPFSRSSLSCTFCRNSASSRASRTDWKCMRLNSRPMISGTTFRKALSPSLACISTSSVAFTAFVMISAAISPKHLPRGLYWSNPSIARSLGSVSPRTSQSSNCILSQVAVWGSFRIILLPASPTNAWHQFRFF